MQELSKKESEVLELIRQSLDRGIVPSVREIGAKMGAKSTSTVHRYLSSLQEKGYIIREDNLNRSIRLPNLQPVSHVPVLGTVTAGQPILAEQSIEEYITVGFLPQDGSELFALHVRGESMINAGILDGDLIIAKRTPVARNGEIVVALIDDEATVKRFYKERGVFRLQPENDTMEPIITDHVRILGRVVGLQRRF